MEFHKKIHDDDIPRKRSHWHVPLPLLKRGVYTLYPRGVKCFIKIRADCRLVVRLGACFSVLEFLSGTRPCLEAARNSP